MTDRIERELLLTACPEEVWDAVTGPGWLAEEVHLELVPEATPSSARASGSGPAGSRRRCTRTTETSAAGGWRSGGRPATIRPRGWS